MAPALRAGGGRTQDEGQQVARRQGRSSAGCQVQRTAGERHLQCRAGSLRSTQEDNHEVPRETDQIIDGRRIADHGRHRSRRRPQAATPPGGPTTNSFDGYYEIVNWGTNKCADVEGNSRKAGAVVHQWSCANDDNQLWKPVPIAGQPGWYQLVNRHSLLCLDLATGVDPVPLGTSAQQWTCGPYATESWRFDERTPGSPLNQFVTNSGGRCLDLDDGSFDNGAKIQAWGCEDIFNTHQFWQFK